MWPAIYDFVLAIAVGLIGTFVCYIALLLVPLPERPLLRRHFLAASVVRILLVFGYFAVLFNAGRDGFALVDDGQYHHWGNQLALSGGRIFGIELSVVNNPGFVWWTAFLYRLFGPNTLIVRVINVIVVGLWLAPTAILAARYGDRRVTRLAIVLVAWMPSLSLLSILHLKDPIAGLAIMTIPAMLMGFGRVGIRVAVSVAAFVVLWYVRIDAVPPLLVVVVSYYLVRSGDIRRILQAGAVTVSIAGLLILLLPRYSESAYGSVITSFTALADFNEFLTRVTAPSESATMLRLFSIGTLSEMWKLPLSMFAVMVLPISPALDPANPHPFVAGLANIPFVLALPFTITGLYDIVRTGRSRMFPVYATALIGLALIAMAGLGVIRYRENFLGFLLIMTAVGWITRGQHRRLVYSTYGVLGLAAIAYWVAKVWA